MSTYKDQIALVLGAHTHVTQMVANENWAMLTTPSVSLMTYSNPGFTTMKLEYFAEDIKTHYLDMAWYYLSKEITYNTFSFKKDFGINEFTPENVQNFHN